MDTICIIFGIKNLKSKPRPNRAVLVAVIFVHGVQNNRILNSLPPLIDSYNFPQPNTLQDLIHHDYRHTPQLLLKTKSPRKNSPKKLPEAKGSSKGQTLNTTAQIKPKCTIYTVETTIL